MKEVWAEIPGFPNYAVSNFGFVVSLRYNTRLTPTPNGKGYMKVRLWSSEGQKQFYVHQLVAMAFFGDYRQGMRIKHVNGDKRDNATTNLRLRNGYTSYDSVPRRGERIYRGRHVQIVETGEVFQSARDAAEHIQGDYTSIYKVLRGQRESHMGYHFEYYDGE